MILPVESNENAVLFLNVPYDSNEIAIDFALDFPGLINVVGPVYYGVCFMALDCDGWGLVWLNAILLMSIRFQYKVVLQHPLCLNEQVCFVFVRN